jgi:hypothetical protein
MSAEFWNVEDRVRTSRGPAIGQRRSRGDFAEGTRINGWDLGDEHRDARTAETSRTAILAGIGRGTASFLGAVIWREDREQIGRLHRESGEPDHEEEPEHVSRYHGRYLIRGRVDAGEGPLPLTRAEMRFSLRPVLGLELHAYISTCTPNSTTRSGGRRKNAVARTAFLAMSTNSFSRQSAIPSRRVTIIVSRPRK